jgi:uncharacterized protein (TIGR02453 family)
MESGMTGSFAGFPKECISFLNGIKDNNTKDWFEEHRGDYENYVLQPSQEFVAEMGDRLRTIAPRLHAEPKVNKSIFRLYRDTRFSPNKTPYKTNLGIWLWEGDGKRMESSGFYFHLAPPELMLSAGIYRLPRHILEEYRKSCVHELHGKALTAAVEAVLKSPGVSIGREEFRRVPRGYDPGHPNAQLLRYGALHASIRSEIPDEIHTRQAVGFCFRQFRKFLPLHEWLRDVIDRSNQ